MLNILMQDDIVSKESFIYVVFSGSVRPTWTMSTALVALR